MLNPTPGLTYSQWCKLNLGTDKADVTVPADQEPPPEQTKSPTQIDPMEAVRRMCR